MISKFEPRNQHFENANLSSFEVQAFQRIIALVTVFLCFLNAPFSVISETILYCKAFLFA